MVDISNFPRGILSRHERDNIAPNASWLDPAQIAANEHWQYQEGKILLGEIAGALIGVRDNRHLVTIAGSRAGKGVSAIIPNLLCYPGSILCIDPKGENARVTAQQRRDMGQAVYVLDPFATSDEAIASFNPLSIIDIEHESCVDDAALIADGIIVSTSEKDKHWTDSARNWIRGLILYIAAHEPEEKRNLLRLRELLTMDSKGLAQLLGDMLESEAGFGVIARAARAFEQKEMGEMSGIISTAIEQTDFLDSPAMQRVLKTNDFALTDLKRQKITVFLCLPAGRMATHNRWLRIMINLAIESMERVPEPPEGEPVLIIMDEFPILGHMEAVEKAAGLIAGYGVRLWTIIQDLSQLKRHYKESWETFLGNAGLVQLFGNTDLTTLKYASERLGQTSVTNISKGEISIGQTANGFTGESVSHQACPLMTPEEIARFFSRQERRQILLWAGANPIAADRVEYYNHPDLMHKANQQPPEAPKPPPTSPETKPAPEQKLPILDFGFVRGSISGLTLVDPSKKGE
jgi:type IV secretion system protein VirD4